MDGVEILEAFEDRLAEQLGIAVGMREAPRPKKLLWELACSTRKAQEAGSCTWSTAVQR